ncbi:hypothetical protein Tco_0035730 [Tanacetum coccineum]
MEKRKKSRTSGLNKLRKVGSASRVESSNDVSLGVQEDSSKHGRKIADLDADAEVTLIDETQERIDEEMFFDVQDDLQSEEVVAKKEVAEKKVSAADPVTTAGEAVTTANVEVTTATQLQAKLEEEERLARQKEEEATIALVESWDNTQAMIEADRLLAERLQTREQEE